MAKKPISYQDFLRQQALDELAALGSQTQVDPKSVIQGTPAQQQQAQSILDQPGQITENYGDIQPGVELFSGGFTNGTGIGVPTGTTAALPPTDEWQVVDAYGDDPYQGYIGDGTNSGYGNSVLAQNTKTGEKLRYSHLSQVNVKPGDILPGGQPVGLTGDTGNASGPHLNLEYYDPNGQLGDVLQSAYARYILGDSSGNKGGKGGGNPLQQFYQGYTSSDPTDQGNYGISPQGLGNFLATDTGAGSIMGAGSQALHALGNVGQMAGHALSALPALHAGPLAASAAGGLYSPNANMIHPEDQNAVMRMAVKLDKGQELEPQDLGDLDALTTHYLGKNYQNNSNPELVRALQHFVDKQNGNPIRFNLPKPRL